MDTLTKRQQFFQKTARRFVDYYVAYVESHQKEYDALDQEINNVLSALESASTWGMQRALVKGISGLTEVNMGVVGFMDARGHWDKVGALLELALEGAKALNDPHLEASILTKLGAFAFRQAKLLAAEDYLKQSLSLLEQLPFSAEVTMQRAHLYEFLARLEMQREPQVAREWLEQGLAELDALHTSAATHQKGYFYVLLATLNGRMGQLKAAIALAEKGLALLPPSPTSARVSGLTTLATASSLLGQIDKSIEYQKIGIEIAQKLGDLRRLATLWMNLGNNQGQRKSNLSAAITSYQKALQLYQQMGDAGGESNVHYNLGLIYIMLGEDEPALSYLTTAIHLAETHGLIWQEAFAKTNLANLLIYQHHLSEGASALNRALKICRQLELTSLLPGVLFWQAEIARLNREHDQGLVLISESLQVAKEGGRLLAEGIAYSIKGKILDAMRRFEEAEAAHQTSLQLLAEQSPYDLAQSKLALAEHHVMRDTQRARCGYVSEKTNSLLVETLATFERIGAKRDIALTKALLEQAFDTTRPA